MVLRIEYKGKLGKILCNERLLKKEYPNDYKKIKNRMIELTSAENLSEISPFPPPKRHKLSDNYEGCWAVSYSPSSRIIFKPIGDYCIDDLKSIREIRIMELKDYH